MVLLVFIYFVSLELLSFLCFFFFLFFFSLPFSNPTPLSLPCSATEATAIDCWLHTHASTACCCPNTALSRDSQSACTCRCSMGRDSVWCNVCFFFCVWVCVCVLECVDYQAFRISSLKEALMKNEIMFASNTLSSTPHPIHDISQPFLAQHINFHRFKCDTMRHNTTQHNTTRNTFILKPLMQCCSHQTACFAGWRTTWYFQKRQSQME